MFVPLMVGSALIFLGRWMHRNPRKFHPGWPFTNQQHPFWVGYGRVFAAMFIFAGSLAIVATLVSHRLPEPLPFFVSLAGGIAGGLFLRPRIDKSISPTAGETASTTKAAGNSFLSPKGKRALGVFAALALPSFISGIGLISNAIGNSEVCRLAVQQAQSNSVVAERLGQPIKRGVVVGGSLSSDSANLWIPLSGPRGGGTLYAVAVRAMGVWKFKALQLAVRGNSNRVDLLSSSVSSK